MDPKASRDLTSLRREYPIIQDCPCNAGPYRRHTRRIVETEEERSPRLSTMAQRGQDSRAEEQRNSRLSDMAQRGQQRRAEETEEQRKENTFWGERNVHVSDNICKKN
ncbi:hypothetical protein AVEN_68987-1 [Araneus ventricosus]|uniref:STPR domain-containing protein n=1 Tax=Araneus ventricosus TaxID=182803 RepID=A0A4Y2V9E2_ARAVE|nr:hypothetical protein AVEN_68987-1 [Araneus ventricosus]